MKRYALVDCNNFYVSCERVFNHKLVDRPVIVLSNNDGCVVSRSNEAKAIGIPMGAPVFKIKDLVKEHDIKVLSSNYPLYADLSKRVMSILQFFVNDLFVYSIDEAFLDLTSIDGDISRLLPKIRKSILEWTGIPVSIGVGPTKTLAKVAGRYAKSNLTGIVNLFELDDKTISKYLSDLEVVDVWGIGRKTSAKLKDINIDSAKDLKEMDNIQVRKLTSVTFERTILELNGISCIDFNTVDTQGITSSRSFRHPVTSFQELSEAISSYTSTAALKLRKKRLMAASITVYILTNRFEKDNGKFYSNSLIINLPRHSLNTSYLISHAIIGLKEIFKPGYKYKKAGIHLHGLVREDYLQYDFLNPGRESTLIKDKKIMNLVDSLNKKMGIGAIKTAAEGVKQSWSMKQDKKSPRYTTSWGELPMAYIK